MATVTNAQTFVSGETVTPAKLNALGLPTVVLADGEVVTAKIANDAVTDTKLAGTLDLSSKTVTLPTASVTLSQLVSAVQSSLVPAGAVQAFAMNSAPTGWLAADGTAVSRSTYAALFSAIGTTHGVGDGSTTFNLPDLRGIFVRGSGSQTISGTIYSGTFAGKQQDELKSHAHNILYFQSTGGGQAAASAQAINSATGVTSSTGGTETRPANIALLYCIKF